MWCSPGLCTTGLRADQALEYQQNLAALPVSILIVLARSNRIEDLAAAVPVILSALAELQPRTLRKDVASRTGHEART